MKKEEKKVTGKTYDGGVADEKIQSWKNVHRRVVRIDIVDGEDLHVVYFKRPSIETMSAVTKISKTDEVKGSTTLYDNCFLGGSEEVRNDAILFAAAAKHLGELFNSCVSSLKNL